MQNCFVIYRQLFLTFIAGKNLKLLFTLNYVLKCANDLKTISNWSVLLSRFLKPFHVNKNRSWAPQTHTRNITRSNQRLISAFEVHQKVHQKSSFLLKILFETDIILYSFERSFKWPFLGIFLVWVNKNLELQIHAEATLSKKIASKNSLYSDNSTFA